MTNFMDTVNNSTDSISKTYTSCQWCGTRGNLGKEYCCPLCNYAATKCHDGCIWCGKAGPGKYCNLACWHLASKQIRRWQLLFGKRRVRRFFENREYMDWLEITAYIFLFLAVLIVVSMCLNVNKTFHSATVYILHIAKPVFNPQLNFFTRSCLESIVGVIPMVIVVALLSIGPIIEKSNSWPEWLLYLIFFIVTLSLSTTLYQPIVAIAHPAILIVGLLVALYFIFIGD